MLTPKQFLAEECVNVQDLLNDTLRNAYDSEESKHFYAECLLRLESLKALVGHVEDTDQKLLRALARQLSFLSQLIFQIERSHLGEFSWPFAATLKDLGVAVCREDAVPSSASDPLFFFGAEGGLRAYRVFHDPVDAVFIGRRIYNVVFPRSFKHHVLLHPILGHEIGHAAQAVPMFADELTSKVVNVLVRGSPLEDAKTFQQWMKTSHGATLKKIELDEVLKSWRQELFCDLFGLVLIGPSFVFAHRSLLFSLDPTGLHISGSHPAFFSRCIAVDHAFSYLGWRTAPAKSGSVVKQAMKRAMAICDDAVKAAPAAVRLLKDRQVELAADALITILNAKNPMLFSQPSFEKVSAMIGGLFNLTPPTKTSLRSDTEFVNEPVNFRDVLLAGWLAWHSPDRPPELEFEPINRLCDRAILFDRAASHWKAHQRATAT